MSKVPGKPLYPVVYLIAALGFMVALDRWFPLIDVGFWAARMFGWSLVVIAIVGVMAGDLKFRQAGTTILPFEDSMMLVTTGIFQMSRNPIYLFMTLGLAGLVFVLGSLTPVAIMLAFPVIIHHKIIPIEEHLLEERFGEKYTDYKMHVRRWL